MTQPYKVFMSGTAVFFAAAFFTGNLLFAAPSQDTEQSSEGMEMIARQMRSLSQSLDRLPGPPAFDQTLQIPGELLNGPGKTTNPEDNTEDER